MKNLQQLMDLHDRVALVTGAAGKIGMAFAHTLAELGCGLAMLDTNEASLAAACAEISGQYGTPVKSFVCDLSNEAELRAIPSAVQMELGRLDILVNNAAFVGTSQLQGWAVPFAEQKADTWRAALEVNLTAVFVLAQAAESLLRTGGHGNIINIGSIYGMVGPDMRIYEGTKFGNPAAYAASKGGLLQLTRWLATALAPSIRVNAITPGGVWRHQSESFCERYISRTPLARMATEEDMKGAMAYLASDMSAYVTGQNIVVDGGWTAW
jgi:NAD(P)-dependent dehydrogenase (short-subunit alcohol dehydrogenase family)